MARSVIHGGGLRYVGDILKDYHGL
jgi:hypothetical protein